jgi:hypothetical protein
MAMCERCRDLVKKGDWDRVHFVWQNRVEVDRPADDQHREWLETYKQAVAEAMKGGHVHDAVPTGEIRVDASAAVEVEEGLVPGVSYAYYEFDPDTVSSVKDLDKLMALKTGTSVTLDFLMAERLNHFGLVFTGWLDVPQSGIFHFYVMSDEGSRLWIGDVEVVNNDGKHAHQMVIGGIHLEKGLHPFRLAYFNGAGGKGLGVYMRNPEAGAFRIEERMRTGSSRKN